MSLTYNQSKVFELLKTFIKTEKIICIAGQYRCGKKHVVNEYIKSIPDTKVLIANIDILFPNGTFDLFSLRENLKFLNNLSKEYDLFYLKDFERAVQLTSSFRFKFGIDSINIWIKFLDQLTIKTILTSSVSNARSLINENIWMIELKITDEDRQFIINTYANPNDSEQIKKAISYSKGNYLYDTYIATIRSNKLYAYSREDHNFDKKNYSREDHNQKITWSEHYKEILSLMETFSLNVDKVVKPDENIHMIGLDHIIKIIECNVIIPIELNHPLIPICKGILLHGPPGTGKTTICRWLTHRLKGRVYQVEPDSDETFASCLKKTLDKASKNTPSVVMIDEINTKSNDKRSILTMLDGFTCYDRRNITIIATTMQISEMNESCIRGGRFERCISFDYPTLNIIKQIIERRFTIAIDGIKEMYPEISKSLSSCIIKTNINNMAISVNSCSPATIHFVIDETIRSAATPEENYNSVANFLKIAKEVKDNRSKSQQIIIPNTKNCDDLYT